MIVGESVMLEKIAELSHAIVGDCRVVVPFNRTRGGCPNIYPKEEGDGRRGDYYRYDDCFLSLGVGNFSLCY